MGEILCTSIKNTFKIKDIFLNTHLLSTYTDLGKYQEDIFMLKKMHQKTIKVSLCEQDFKIPLASREQKVLPFESSSIPLPERSPLASPEATLKAFGWGGRKQRNLWCLETLSNPQGPEAPAGPPARGPGPGSPCRPSTGATWGDGAAF